MAVRRALSGPCPIERGVALVGDSWSMLILRDVSAGTRRFDQLRVNLSIAGNILAKRLKALVASGLLEKRRYSTRPPRDEYILTPAGADFLPILYAIGAWARRHGGDEALDLLVDLETGVAIDPLVVDRAGGWPLVNLLVGVRAAK